MRQRQGAACQGAVGVVLVVGGGGSRGAQGNARSAMVVPACTPLSWGARKYDAVREAIGCTWTWCLSLVQFKRKGALRAAGPSTHPPYLTSQPQTIARQLVELRGNGRGWDGVCVCVARAEASCLQQCAQGRLGDRWPHPARASVICPPPRQLAVSHTFAHLPAPPHHPTLLRRHAPQHIIATFGADLQAMGDGAYDSWRDIGPLSLLAGVVLADQFSRNVHRGTPKAFALDPKGLAWALHAMVCMYGRQAAA
jgi:hypothetical protein